MDLLTAILTCSLYAADDGLVRAIAESNPQSNPYFVLDASSNPTEVDAPAPPTSTAQAVARTSDILAKGGRPVMGLLQLPPAWLGAFGRALPEAFDPCVNIAIGTAMLSDFDAQCAAPRPGAGRGSKGRAASSAERRRCILRKYEEAIGMPDFAAMALLELRYQHVHPAAVFEAPIFASPSAPSWGPDQLFWAAPLATSAR